TKYLEEFPTVKVENMIIYHWRKKFETHSGSSSKGVSDFMALCSFRQLRGNLGWFGIAAVVIGAIGNSVQALGASLLACLHSPALIQLVLIGISLVVMGLIYFIFRRLDRGC